MRAFTITGLLIGLLLLAGSPLHTGSGHEEYWPVNECTGPVIPENTPEIQSPAAHNFLVIETSVFSRILSEVYRLLFVSVQANRIIPLQHDFRSRVLIPVLINFSSPVSIFIRGHSLRH